MKFVNVQNVSTVELLGTTHIKLSINIVNDLGRTAYIMKDGHVRGFGSK